jgi:hypothetical protein
VLGPLLFAVAMDPLEDMAAQHGLHIGRTSYSALVFADDLVTIASTEAGMRRQVDIVSSFWATGV